jgi:copper(I)-binding protein
MHRLALVSKIRNVALPGVTLFGVASLGVALLAVALLGMVPPALADQNGIAVTDAWSRAAMAGRMGVVYLTITDTGAPDQLTGASSPVAAKATLHESFDDHGVMKMRPVAALPVQPGSPVKFAPGGYHIMLEGLKQPLQPGQTFPVTLTFAHAGAVTTTALVQKAGAATDHGSMPGMTMQSGAAMPGMNMQGGAGATSMPGMTMGGAPQH